MSQDAKTSANILLVEDNADDETLTLEAFSSFNIRNSIDVVRDGAEALEYLFCEGRYKNRTSAIALVVLDLKLPKISGLEVLKRVRADERTKTVPIVIFSSSKEERDLIEGYRLGANSFIRKPIEFSDFTNAVRQFGLYWLLFNEAEPKQKS